MTKVAAKSTITIELDGQKFELTQTEARELYVQLKSVLNITDSGWFPLPATIEDVPKMREWYSSGTGEPPTGYRTSVTAGVIEPGNQLDLWFENEAQKKLRGVETS